MKKTKIRLYRCKRNRPFRNSVSIVPAVVFRGAAIAIGGGDLAAIILMNRQAARLQMPLCRRWINPPPAGRKRLKLKPEPANKFKANLSLAKASLKFLARALDSFVIRNATLCRRHRTFS